MRSKIIFEDKDILVCYKPAGIAVQSARLGEPDMMSELKNYLKGGYVGLVHRLDQPVSGLLVFAKNQKAAAALSKQVSGTGMQKTYYARVWCRDRELETAPVKKRLTDFLIKEPKGNTSRVARAEEPGAKKAELFYRCLQKEGNTALMEVELLTGRHHQIRLQLAHAGLPILGDLKYGSEASKGYAADMGIKNVCLGAVKLSFKHPSSGKVLNYECIEKICF